MAHATEGSNDAGRLVGARVVDAQGHQASVVSIQQIPDEPDAHAWVRLDDGAQVLVPVGLLAPDAEGAYRLPFSIDSSTVQRPVQMTFPVMEEELQVGKRTVDTGRGVRIHKTVSERQQVVDEPLLREELVVEHVPVGRVVADTDPPQTRYEGNTLVVPVLEEVLVVQKQLLLKEELRITRQQHREATPRTVSLRAEEVTLERFDEGKDRQA
ncbi:YsnF/AvaK domain-containing protein [Noviherbaspirillum agri]